jgi:hypothetical protein
MKVTYMNNVIHHSTVFSISNAYLVWSSNHLVHENYFFKWRTTPHKFWRDEDDNGVKYNIILYI